MDETASYKSYRITTADSYVHKEHQDSLISYSHPKHSLSSEQSSNSLPKTLSLQATPASTSLSCGTVHKLWSMIRLDALDRTKYSDHVTNIDFVVVIDHSASMKNNNKLAFVQATIEYLINNLN